jgi:hypothetical protein
VMGDLMGGLKFGSYILCAPMGEGNAAKSPEKTWRGGRPLGGAILATIRQRRV